MPKTVVFVDHTAALSGGEIALLHLVRHLDRSRFVPVVLLSSAGPLCEKLREAEVETHVLPLADSIVHTRKDELRRSALLRGRDVARTLRYCGRLARFMRRRRADLVHTNSLKADVMGGVAARLAGIPVVWHIRDRIENDYLPPKVVRVFRRLCRILPNVVIANSAATLQSLHLPGGADSKGQVVHDGVPAAAATPDASLHDGPQQAPLIGIVGRLSPWKGQHIFLQAAAVVREQFSDAQFQIIGSAMFGEEEYEAEVRALAESLGLNGCLEWTGFRTDVPDLLQKLDILVHASTTGEPFGQVVVEGMLAGKPIVATNGGGVPEIVQDGVTGILVPMSDDKAMSAAIIELLRGPARAQAMGQAGRRRVLDHFTIEQTARKVEAVYEEVLRRKGGKSAARN